MAITVKTMLDYLDEQVCGMEHYRSAGSSIDQSCLIIEQIYYYMLEKEGIDCAEAYDGKNETFKEFK